MDFFDILEKYRAESHSEREKGNKFEELIVRYFVTDPTYSTQLEYVVLWNDFFAKEDFGGKDIGIDLVAKDITGGFWAIQCKCYSEESKIYKDDVDTFLATSSKKFYDEDGNEVKFSLRLFVATTDELSSAVTESFAFQDPPVSILKLNDLVNAPVDWEKIEDGVHGNDARVEKYTLRPHQVEAFNHAMEYYENHDRGKMIMACGTGKTFTSQRIAEAIVKKNHTGDNVPLILVLEPSISLVGQVLREWTANSEEGFYPICVCSDTSVSKATKKDDDSGGDRIEYLGLPATTKPNEIVSRYKSSSEPVVIFSTYQSIDALIDAQNLSIGLPEIDIIICDEAHRTTGAILDDKEESNFTKVHSNSNIVANKRLYMTATPRLYGVKGKEDAKKVSAILCSMDDESLYGEEFHNISFGKAVQRELLSDYKVLILTISAKDVPDIIKRFWTHGGKEIDADTDCKIWGCLNALKKNIANDSTLKATDPEPMHSAVAFSRSIKVSKAITERFNELSKNPMSPYKVRMKHIDGSMNSNARDKLLNWLKDDNYEGCNILSNVRCLCEGVDVPALDAVMFLDSKNSLTDVVQAVGRVMRKSEGKKYGYIIIPIIAPEEEDPESALDDNERYKVVWNVLRALRSHDERLEAEINTFNYHSGGNGHIIIGGSGGDGVEPLIPPGGITLDDFQNAFLARLVTKVGNRQYIETWAKSVAEITPILSEKLTEICHKDNGQEGYKDAFNNYLNGLRACVNNDVSPSQGIDMLVQQIVTKPIFEELFAKDGFAMRNSVSEYIDRMLEEVDAKNGLKDIQDKLDEHYEKVKLTLENIDTTEGKQKVITALYEKFFKHAFPKDQAINGVVYTPTPVVDFIIRSAADILKSEFGMDINDENVNVLDPFTGTGTFIARLLESGIITKENIFRKYTQELFANEITLLAYYIAIVNIENTFQRVSGLTVYAPFENILLTDTFNIEEICSHGGTATQSGLFEGEYFSKNRERIRKENNAPITIIVGNPPYGANQKSANDDAKRRKYISKPNFPSIDERIKESYLDDSRFSGNKGNVNSVYDNYIRAFRWATDRLRNENGIIAFVTPSGWLTGSAFEGFRNTIESEFSKIFIFDLRGDATTQGERRRKEGDGIFGEGSRTPIAVTLLVKQKNICKKAKIQYIKVPDYQKRIEKLNLLKELSSFARISNNDYISINPKPNGDWIMERNDVFQTMIPIAGDTHKKFDKHVENTIFVGYSGGYKTNRDAWAYNYSKEKINSIKQSLIESYNEQINMGSIDYNIKSVKWTTPLNNSFKKKQHLKYELKTTIAHYRPFNKRWFDCDDTLNEASYQNPRLYPNNTNNLTICVSSIGDKKDFSCLMTNVPTDLHLTGTSQVFPLYWYENKSIEIKNSKQTKLFESDEKNIIRHDGISNYALNVVSKKYNSSIITKENIFFYVYGYLHSPEYKNTFSDDLKLSLPKIDFVDSYEEFKTISDAGRKLSHLHTNYEDIEPYMDVTINGENNVSKILSLVDLHRVTKMKLIPESHKLIYNEYITIENIPQEAFEYIVNGRNAIGWLVEQYQITTDKESGIVNDPNEYAGGTYILKLILSVINVSIKTMEIIKSLPKLSFDNKGETNQNKG